jgi:endonuclease/exonuclease/phosphatase family metal-dependent hydrolase
MVFPELAHFGKGRYHSIALDRPHETLSGEHCSIFYRTDRFVLESCGTFWHSEAPDVPGSVSWGNALPRTTTWGIFADLTRKARFCVLNSHLHWDEPYVSNTARLLRERLLSLSEGLPAVVAGDFNAVPGSELHHRLVRPDGAPVLRDTWESAGLPEAGAGTYHGFTGRPQQRIDWILVTPDIEVVSVRKDTGGQSGRFPSDHFPVVAELVIETGRS